MDTRAEANHRIAASTERRQAIATEVALACGWESLAAMRTALAALRRGLEPGEAEADAR